MKTLLKDIATIQTGLFAKTQEVGEIVYLQAKHFDENGNLLSNIYPDIGSIGIAEKHLLQPGDVLFAAKGSKNFAAVYESHHPAAVASTSFFVIKPWASNILPAYLSWLLNNADTQNFIKEHARGTAMQSIRKSVLEEIEVPIPSLEKQHAIIRLVNLADTEKHLRLAILQKRKLLIEHQITNLIK
ncbi:type I restriction modification DNA specificity protein [Dyadobacter jejuensis]|uniref:Type I restriction modification DNA specificity protein n=1 Tax=Dyadobacter jejuensis TaxID=1082580 RepID=A0A316ACQ9_9BACT|nr:restriction endonuclease subunit S [Dyadobacter jejuensis]PWJ54760.1 type I restriction modification DNA specificity protein [Dyadobacter jejuensis]